MELVKRCQNSKWTVPVLLLLLTILTAPILGTSPFLWHTFTLLLRWLTSWLLWWVLKLIWPNHIKEATWAALLFSVHPVFLQQSIAVAYSQHFITYALFFLSCGTMLAAVQKPRCPWLLIGISIISAILHIFTMEYFWGLELIRPLLLWLAFTNQGTTKENRIKQTIFRWLPYLAILITAVVWRVGFYSLNFEAGDDPNSLRLLTMLKTTPFDGIIHFIEMVTRDFIYVMVTVWSSTIQPDLINLERNILGFSWILVALSLLILWIYRTRFTTSEANDQTQIDSSWIRQAIVLGIIIFIAGTLPVWITDKSITSGMYADRFALPGMWGASILLVGLLSLIGISSKPRSVILSIMIALAIGSHFRVSNDYRWDWTNQQRFFWQLYWRAPELEPKTPIFSDGTIFSFVGEYPTAFAINTFYVSENSSTELPYWFIELDSGFHNDPASYLNGYTLSKSLRNYSFRGYSLESIVLYYNPYGGNCLWLLDERDGFNMDIPSLTRDALPLSVLSRISGDDNSKNSPSKTIYGNEPEHNWCFYYQNATAARQDNDWEEIIQIKSTVNELGHNPNNKLEWIPFIEAYAQVGLWEDARELTISAYERAPVTRKTFCNLWSSYTEFNMEAGIDQYTITDVISSLGCQ